MTVTTIGSNLVIEVPNNIIDIKDVQAFLNYLRYKTIVSKSQATDEDIKEITDEINESLAKRNQKYLV